jgi:hypothetical protein
LLPLQVTSPNNPPNEATPINSQKMARSKPNKPLKSPNKKQDEEQNKTNKTQIITTHTMKINTKTTGT